MSLRMDIRQWRVPSPPVWGFQGYFFVYLFGLFYFLVEVTVFSQSICSFPVLHIVPLKPTQIIGHLSESWRPSQILKSTWGRICSLASGGDLQEQLGGNGGVGWGGPDASRHLGRRLCLGPSFMPVTSLALAQPPC